MMPLHGDRSAIMQATLPEDPEPGQEFILPEGQTVGGANVINISKAGKLLGAITRVSPIPNVSGKYDASRVHSKAVLRKGDVVRIQGWQHNYNALKFVEYFGWVGSQTTGDPISLLDKYMRVLAVFEIGESTTGFHLYERVCLEAIKGDQDASKSTNPPTAARRNQTKTGRGSSAPQGSSSSSRRTATPSGSKVTGDVGPTSGDATGDATGDASGNGTAGSSK